MLPAQRPIVEHRFRPAGRVGWQLAPHGDELPVDAGGVYAVLGKRWCVPNRVAASVYLPAGLRRRLHGRLPLHLVTGHHPYAARLGYYNMYY